MKSGSTVIIVLFSSLLMVFISVSPALALWSSNPSVNTPVITNGVSYTPQMVSDGSGGAIIVWSDYRNTSNAKLYAQRIDAQGDPVWTANGVAVCSASGDQTGHQVVSDGSGGVVITWQDQRTSPAVNHIYAQRIDADGNVMWAPDGVAVCTASGGSQYYPRIVSDYFGGAIITWIDNRTPANSGDVYAQRIDANGNAVWTTDGVGICVNSTLQGLPVIATDGAGGAIIAWNDNRDGAYSIYAQRVNDEGTVVWPGYPYPTGIRISSYLLVGNQMSHSIAYDGMNGVIVVWRNGYYDAHGWDVYAQRVLINGTLYWSGGVAVSTAGGSDTEAPVVTDDGNQGAIITWQDNRASDGGNPNIYAQRINATGSAQWAANGVMINSASSVSRHPQIVGDGSSGAVITWQRDDSDIYAQRVNSSGLVQWTTSVSTAANIQNSPQIINNGIDGVIMTWSDGRNNYASDIYAQKAKMSNGTLPFCPNRITLNPSTLPGGSYNTAYNQTFSASGGAGPYSFELTGDLPGGIGFSSPTLSGTPTTTGIFPITLKATDFNACIATKNYTLAVKADTTTTITSHTPNPSSGGQTVTINYTVTSLFGTPTGNVTVGDGIVSCTGTVEAGTCSLEFNTVGPKTLTAQFLGDASFNASISAGEPHEVTPSSIRINGTTPSYYATIQSVYNAAGDGDTIQIQAGDFPEALNFNRNISVTIQGGFDTEFTIPPSGTTTIAGPLTISDGTIIIDNLIIY